MQCFAHFSLFCASNLRVMKKNIAIFASGSGSNAENIIRYFQKSDSATVSLVLSNKSDAYVLERSHRLKVPCNVFPKEDWIAGDEILAILQEYRIDFIVLAGFLVVIPEQMIAKYRNRIINIHPSLIPSFCGTGYYGLKVHEGALARGVKVTGATVHFVDEGTDTGPIILQKAVEVQEGDTPEILQRRVMEQAEWKIMPQAIDLIANGKVTVTGKTVHISK